MAKKICKKKSSMNFSDAQNATTHSENTVKHCAFKGEILKVAVKLKVKLSIPIYELLEVA